MAAFVKAKLANINREKSYPVCRPSSLPGQVSQYRCHKNHRHYYKQDYINNSCRLASYGAFECEKTVDSC